MTTGHLSPEQVFHEARAIALPGEREAYLKGACGNDAALRSKVDALLLADAEAGTFLASTGPVTEATVEAAPREQAGTMIGRYRLLQPIGEGGFGVVWMAEQREPVRRRVAVKIIKLGMDTKQVIARFEAERQALAMMDHPNIAKVLDAGATDTGRPYFVMEYIRGVPILEYCDTEKLHTTARLELFMAVCHAIQHAHQKGIIHRDIKPGNVLLTMHDGVPVPKVIDFGIAKATNTELTQKTLFTQHRQMIGTPAYMSPEQAEMSALDIDTRSDVYSLGVLLYELLTGTTPFDTVELMSKGFAEMMRIIREEEPHKPSTRLSTLGDTATRTARQRHVDVKKLGSILRGDLDWIVMKCLEKDRTRRYETANGLAADIRRHLDHEPVAAGPPAASYRLRKFVRRNRGQVIAAAIVAAVLVLGIAGTTGGMLWALQQKNRAESAEQATQRELTRTREVKYLIKQVLNRVDPAAAQGADTTLLKGILDDTAARLAKGEVRDELIAAELRDFVGSVYIDLGLFDDAERHLPLALEIRRDILGEEHPDTLTSMHRLAILHQKQGRYAEAESLYLETLEIGRRVLNEGHASILGSMSNLAGLYESQGRFAEAESLCLETLTIRKRVRGEEHRSTLHSMNTLAGLYRSQGRFAEAEPLCLETLTIRKRVLGEEHPDTLASMDSLGWLYQKQGRFAEAEPLCLETLTIRKRVLGEEHPDTLSSMDSLAGLYQSQGRFAEAEPLCLETLTIRKRVLGEEHSGTLSSMDSLGRLYQKQGRFAEAEPLCQEALTIRKRVLGEEHPGTLGSMNNLALHYWRQDRHAEAEPLYLEALPILKRVLGEEHPDTLGTITNLGLLYNSMGRYDDARELLETSVPVKQRVFGMRHPWTKFAMEGLAESYTRLGRGEEALPLRRELLELQLAVATRPDADAGSLNEAAWVLLTHNDEELRDPARAHALALRACAREEAAGGASLWMCLDTLALAQHLTGDTAAAIDTQRRAVSLIPEDADDAAHEGLETNLRTFEAALAETGNAGAGGGDR